jgi:Domain of unknown function (DUF4382)
MRQAQNSIIGPGDRLMNITSNLSRIRIALAAMTLALVAACGGGSMGSSNPVGTGPGPQSSADTGTALVTLTDAPGDFLAYGVNVVSVELKRADGTLVETLPASTQVDFAQLVDFSEILSATQVPAGVYVGASLTLDYASALIVVDNGSGGLTVLNSNIVNSVTDAALVGANSRLTLSMQLPTSRPLVVTKGTIAHLALDFDLAATNTVVPAAPGAGTLASDVKVRVNPVLLAADIVPDPTKELRLRGTLVSVTNTPPTAMSYKVNVAPFNLRGDASHGEVVVKTTDATTFVINGVTNTGTAGLAALGALPTGSLTLAQGTFDRTTQTYTASTVLAGTSLPLAGMDLLQGTVIARSGNVLTVAGALSLSDFNDPSHTYVPAGSNPPAASPPGSGNAMGHRMGDRSDDDGWRFQFNRQVPVTIGSGTRVTRAGSTVPGTAQDISVGQSIAFYGKLGQDSAGARTFDATQGGARLLVTGLWGNFVSQAAGVATLGLQQLNGRLPSAYNFAGTGTSSATDVNPTAYTVAVPPVLNLGTPAVGAPLRFLGFVAPFGAAPPAFNAVTLVSYAATAARVDVDWMFPGITAPFTQADQNKVVISQGTLQSAQVAQLHIGPQGFDLSNSVLGITFAPNPTPSFSAFAIIHRKTARISPYDTFGNMVLALNTALNGTTALFNIHAEGPYDASTGTVSVNRMVVVVND